MKRLIENLARDIPEMMIGEVTKKKKRIENKRHPGSEEDCLMMLEGLTLCKRMENKNNERAVPIITKMGSMQIIEEKIIAAVQTNTRNVTEHKGGMEDEWLDFSDPEDEQEALELVDKAENKLMREFEKTERQTSPVIELTCQEREVQMSEQTGEKRSDE